jgi:hypothetical protein
MKEEPGTGAGTPTPLGTSSTRQGRRLQPPLVGRRKGRSRRRKEPDRNREPYAARNAYHATPSTLSIRLRLHRRPDVSTTAATLSLSSLLELCSVLRRRRWGASSCRLAWLPAFKPQNCRVALVRSSRATHAPGPADAMRGPFVVAGLRAKRVVQERVRRHVASRRARVTRRPRRANRLERVSATRALGLRASGELHAGPPASRAAKDAAAAR